jgi:hypothetical protein
MMWGKIGGVITTGLADRDIGVGFDVATNTLENSFLPMMVNAVKMQGVLDKRANSWGRIVDVSEGNEDIRPVMDVLQTLGEDLEEIKQEQALRQGRKKP